MWVCPTALPRIQISYYEQVAKNLKLASGFPGGPWTLTTLDAPFDVGRYNSLVWDGAPAPTISYYQAGGKLKAYQAAPAVVDPQQDLGAFNDIVFGGAGDLHISYSGVYVINNLNKRAQVRHAVFNGSSWSVDIVDDAPVNFGSFTSIAYDPVADTYHISYRGQNGRLRHAFGNTGSWTKEDILPASPLTANVGQTSILVDSSGGVHIFYSKSGTGGGLYHAWKDGGGWNVELVATGFGIMTPSAAVQDLLGFFRVAAYKSGTQDLVLFSSGSWNAETIDSTGDVGKFAAIAVDPLNCLHISYVRADFSNDLKYATNSQERGCIDLSQIWVDDDWAGFPCGKIVAPGKAMCLNAFATIQDGVDAVADGGTVNVAPGTYNETVTFGAAFSTDNLTISGTDPNDRPVVTAGVNFQNTSDLDGLTLKNLYLKGDGGGGKIVNMVNSGKVNDFTVDNCVLDGENASDPPRHGIAGNGFSGSFTITHTEFKNILGWALMDINSGSGDGGSDFALTTVTFANDYIHDSDGTVALRGKKNDRTDVVNVYGNIWNNIGGNNPATDFHWAAVEVNHADVANIYDNQISNVVLSNLGAGQAMQIWDVGTVNIHDNDILNNARGITILGAVFGDVYAIPSGSIFNNNIVGNIQWGIGVDPAATGGPLNAENNWWGDASGPFDPAGTTEVPPCTGDPLSEINLDGLGNPVSDNVDYCPWSLTQFP